MTENNATHTITTNGGERELVMERLFDAPRKLVFQVFTEPEHVARWWPPFGFTIPVCTIDLRPGGLWHYCMRSPEDLDALITAAGGSAYVYGTSGTAILALEVAARGLAGRIKKLALWEPSYIVDDSRPPLPQDYQEQLKKLLRESRRGDMLELFFTKAVDMPVEFVAMMRQAPFWPAQEAVAHTLIDDATFTRDLSLPKERIATVTVPTLVIDGGQTPWLSHAAQAVAEILPHAQRRTIAGQPHNVDPEALVPVLVEFFKG